MEMKLGAQMESTTARMGKFNLINVRTMVLAKQIRKTANVKEARTVMVLGMLDLNVPPIAGTVTVVV